MRSQRGRDAKRCHVCGGTGLIYPRSKRHPKLPTIGEHFDTFPPVQCAALTTGGGKCARFASIGYTRCAKHEKQPIRYRRKDCKCGAYPWPHRPGGGRCDAFTLKGAVIEKDAAVAPAQTETTTSRPQPVAIKSAAEASASSPGAPAQDSPVRSAAQGAPGVNRELSGGELGSWMMRP